MRREFILILLGIICASTFSSLMSSYSRIEADRVLLDSVAGSVGAGNFSYWQLVHTGPLIVQLTSIKGDADLYISDTLKPSYEVDTNNFSSATCGPDIVNIPAKFPRPICIGVYGYRSHELSDYTIQVYLDTTAVLTEEQLLAIQRASQGSSERSDPDTKKTPAAQKAEDESKPRVLRLLNILDMIFEMLFLWEPF